MLNKLKEFWRKEQFQPSFVAIFINPFYFARKGLFENISFLAKHINGKTLDVGCGRKPYERLFSSSQYVGLEIDSTENRLNKKADFYYDGSFFPFQDKEFDSIVVNQVFEHVFNPTEFLFEVNRVLKMDGILLMTVPFVWDEHEQPHDFARYSSFGLLSLLQNKGFQVIEHRKSINDIRVIFQLLNAYIYKKTFTGNAYINVFLTMFLIAPFNIIGQLLSPLFPRNNDLYLDNIVLAKKVENV